MGEHDKHFMFGIKKDKQKLHANYRIGRIIGDGNFAVVRECTHRKTTKSYALKIINKAKVKGKEHMIENEIHILRKIIHPNIVKLHEEFETQKEIYLVMELVTGGDLFDAIVANTRFSEPCSAYMIRDLASAVKYLHELSIVHRDIKPENLLVVNRKDGRRSLKLADFGLSIEVKAPVYLVCGTPTYVAPEILDESGYGLKVDVWAIGVICYILLCGFPPFRSANHDQEELFDKILRGDYEYLAPFWDDVNDGPKDLIDRLLVVDASERYDADEVLNHYWIKKWISPSESALKKQKQRPRLRPIAMALVSFLSLLRLVRSRQHRTDAYTNIRSMSDNGTSRPYPVLSRIPRPKPSAGFHIAEIRKSITTPTHRASRSDSTSGADRKAAVGGEEYKPVASPECTLKKGFLKREEVIKRVLRSNSDRKSHLASKPTARVRPTSAAHSKVRTTTPTASGHSTPTKTLKEDNDSKKLFVPRPCQHGNIFGGNNIGFNSASSDRPAESVKPSKHRLTSSASVRDLKSSVDAVQDSVPVRKRSTSAKLRPRSMIETTKASSELNLSKPSNETKPVEKPRNSSVIRRMSLERRNKNDCGDCNTPKRSVAMSNLANSDSHWSRGYQTDSETQNSCKCSPSATVTRQSSQRIANSQSNLQSQQKVFSSGEFAFTGENTSNTSIRKSRSSCRKVPRKPVFRHASSIQSLASDKYGSTRRGLYRVKSLESTHHSITGCGGTTGSCGANVSGGGSTRGSSRSLQQECSSCALPPWNPSTNVNSKPGSIAASSPLSRKRGLPTRPQSGTNKLEKTKGTSGSEGAGFSDLEKHDKGIKITTEVNKRKNIKFPDGKTVDEEVKTTTTVRVQNYGPPAEEECEESSLLTKVKNLAIEIGSLAKVKYNLSSDSSSDSVLLTNDKPAPPHVTNISDSDLTDTATNKEETDRFSETEYLSAFRKK